MAIFHFDVRYFSRRRGQCIVASASYRSGQRLHDYYYGETHDFTAKGGIVHTAILLPPNAPREYSDREILWNEVEFREDDSTQKTKARLAREVEGSLPIELSALDEQIQLVEEYVRTNYVEHGMCADIAIHNKGDGQPHFHCLLTTRNVSTNGFGLKNREWDKDKYLEIWRREWANLQNRELERRGFEPISHESYAVQDFGRRIERIPTIHIGAKVQKLDRIGIEIDRMKEYREITERRRNLEIELQQKRERKRNRGRER